MTIGAIGINGTSLLALATKQKAFLAIVGMLVFMAFFPTNFYTAFNLLDMLNSTSILLILAFIGGAHLSMDTTAGERERQSLEPLLATPAPRSALVSGKMLAAACIGISSLVLTLLAFKLSANLAGSGFARMMDVSFVAIGKTGSTPFAAMHAFLRSDALTNLSLGLASGSSRMRFQPPK